MERHGIEWEQLGTHRDHLSVLDYKKQERIKEVAILDEQITDKSVEYESISKRIKNFDDGIANLDKLENQLNNDSEYQLPVPQGLMSAKTYKTRFADPLVERLKWLLKEVLTKLYRVWDDYLRLNAANRRLYHKNEQLTQENAWLSSRNKILAGNSRKYRALCKVFGKERLNDMMEQELKNKQFKHCAAKNTLER